jgi:hypothetical protein
MEGCGGRARLNPIKQGLLRSPHVTVTSPLHLAETSGYRRSSSRQFALRSCNVNNPFNGFVVPFSSYCNSANRLFSLPELVFHRRITFRGEAGAADLENKAAPKVGMLRRETPGDEAPKSQAFANSMMIADIYFAPAIIWSILMFSSGACVIEVT